MENVQVTLENPGITTLATAGKYCHTNVEVNAEAVFAAGKQAASDLFWDAFQNYGNRTDYYGAFHTSDAFGAWGEASFKPKYDLQINSASEMFWGWPDETDLPLLLDSLGLSFDTTNIRNTTMMFYNTQFVRLPLLDFYNATTALDRVFAYSTKLKTIDKLILSANTKFDLTSGRETFRSCNELENLTIGGTIGQNGLDLHWSHKLSKASIISIITALSDDTNGMAVTLSATAWNAAFQGNSAEEESLLNSKPNWTIALVD